MEEIYIITRREAAAAPKTKVQTEGKSPTLAVLVLWPLTAKATEVPSETATVGPTQSLKERSDKMGYQMIMSHLDSDNMCYLPVNIAPTIRSQSVGTRWNVKF